MAEDKEQHGGRNTGTLGRELQAARLVLRSQCGNNIIQDPVTFPVVLTIYVMHFTHAPCHCHGFVPYYNLMSCHSAIIKVY